MKSITNKQYEEYQDYLRLQTSGKILTPDGLALIIRACDFDPRKIGEEFLEIYARQRNVRRQELPPAVQNGT